MILTPTEIAAVAQHAGFKTPQAIATITAISLAENGGQGQTGQTDTGYTLPSGGQSENSVGLAQINTLAHPQYSPSSLLNPFANLEAALSVSNGGTNFMPWTTYQNGAYATYLPTATRAANQVVSNPSLASAIVQSLGAATYGAGSGGSSTSGGERRTSAGDARKFFLGSWKISSGDDFPWFVFDLRQFTYRPGEIGGEIGS